ncbi:MAG: DNA polymerase III subunit alpha [Planctomycetes bacterium]|nr:DNA polymerase III subunit alpha [Planctomycetota bacterium]
MASKRTTSTGFVHLVVRSEHSHLYGASRLDELIQAARALGYRDLALTDRGGLYGSIAFYQKAREAGLRPILGVELVHPSGKKGTAPFSPARPSRAVCLARNLAGYRTLCRLTSALHLDPRFDLAEALAADHADIYVLVPDAALPARLAGRLPQGRLFALMEEFGDRSTRLKNDGLSRAAARRGIPLVAGGAVAFHVPSRYEVHRTLRAIATRATVADVPRRELAHPQAYLKSPEEMAALFSRWPEAALNTVRITADCNLELPMGRPIFPRAAVPAGETACSALAKLAFAGLQRLYRPLRPEAVARLEMELSVIGHLGFCDYFLIMHEIVSWTRAQGIPCVARGSAAGSLAAWCLGISGIDPLKYGLLFERFLNLERADCPDIDLDVCWRRRDDVLRHVYQTYGAARVAMISTHQTFQARSALREVARAHGLAPDEVDRLSQRLPYFPASGIRDAVLSFPECRDIPIGRPDVARIVDVAAALDGLPRHLSVHVGGLVIADRPLTDYLPLQAAAKGLVIAQYEAGAVEALGLVKMDILAQRSLSILETAKREIEKNHALRIDLATIEDGDPAAAALLERGDTFGCFQIESPGMRNLLRRMSARGRMDVILGLSLIRPGPASSGMKDRFVRRRRGLEPPECLHPALRDVLGDTYGVMLYQEDVIRVAHAAAGLTLAEGDRLRKDLGRGPDSPQVRQWRERFLRGARAAGARREQAEALWDHISRFAAYAYCKAHACTYGEIAYRAVWLRARWPAEFAAAVLANQAGYYERRTYLEDARRRGVPILGPDVNASPIEPATEWVTLPPAAFSREPRATGCLQPVNNPTPSRATGCLQPVNNHTPPRATGCLQPVSPEDAHVLTSTPPHPARQVALRMGLMDVRGLSQRAMRGIVDARACGGPYRSAADLAARVKLSREETENLALAGALDALAGNRPRALWQVHALARRSAASQAGGMVTQPGGMVTLLGDHDSSAAPPAAPPCPDLPDYSPLQKLLAEDHVLGMTPSAHPMAVYRERIIADCESRIAEPRERGTRNPERGTNDKEIPGRDFVPRSGLRVPSSASSTPLSLCSFTHHSSLITPHCLPLSALPRLVGKQVCVAGLLFAARRARTRDGRFMKFISLEDETGIVEAVLLPDAYQRLGGRLSTRGPYIVSGAVEDHLGALSLIVSDLCRFQAGGDPDAPRRPQTPVSVPSQ